MIAIETISYVFLALAVFAVAGLWLSALFRNLSVTEFLILSVFSGISTIALIGQSAFYLLGSFEIGFYVLIGISVLGLISIAYRRKKIALRPEAVQFVTLLLLVAGALVTNIPLIAKGVENYPASNNPDIWYYAAVTQAVTSDDTSYIDYSMALNMISGDTFSGWKVALEQLGIGQDEKKITIHNRIVDTFVGDKYYFLPGKTPLVSGVTTRNGNEFLVAYLSSVFSLEVKATYNVINGIYAFLTGMAALWVAMSIGIPARQLKLLSLLSTVSSLVYSGAFTQWPAMLVGIPLIAFLLGVTFRLLSFPTRLLGIAISLALIGAASVYPEGLIILILPVSYMIYRKLMTSRRLVFAAFDVSWSWLVVIAVSLGIPSLVLAFFRLSKITGKFTLMPGPEYVGDWTVIFTMWIQPHFLHRSLLWLDNPNWIDALFRLDINSLMHLAVIIFGSIFSVFIVLGPWIARSQHSEISKLLSLSFVILFTLLFCVGSRYSLDKLIHYYVIFFAIIASITWSGHMKSGYRTIRVFSVIAIFGYFVLVLIGVGGLMTAEVRRDRAEFLPDAHFPLKKYVDLRLVSAVLSNTSTSLLVALPDEMPQLWATHYLMNKAVVLPHGINYLSDYVNSARSALGDKYPGLYDYMLIPGPGYPTLEDYGHIQRRAVWTNSLFSLVPRDFFFILADPITYGPVQNRSFYRIESEGAHAFRWINTSLRYKYFNGQANRNQLMGIKLECESVNDRPVPLAIKVDGKVVGSWSLQARSTFEVRKLANFGESGSVEIINSNPQAVIFPRDERPVTFRCFNVQIGPDSTLSSHTLNSFINSSGELDLKRSDVVGYYSDGWISKTMKFYLPKSDKPRILTVKGERPQALFPNAGTVKLWLGDRNMGNYVIQSGSLDLAMKIPSVANDGETIILEFDGVASLRAPDTRSVSARVLGITVH